MIVNTLKSGKHKLPFFCKNNYFLQKMFASITFLVIFATSD